LFAARTEQKKDDVALVRIEQLYPLDVAALRAALDRYPRGARFIWVQEEPLNMGAWPHMSQTLPSALDGPLTVVARPPRSKPAAISAGVHKIEQARVVDAALG
jgi:2-oxoglutarate dehydrogenase complex dehydrogenase (E1) component-like enzyme